MSNGNTADLNAMLDAFWMKQSMDMTLIDDMHDWKFHQLPLARIKKVMKLDDDAKHMMISAEAPIIFAKACEMFILELTLRAWTHTEEGKRRTLQKSDVAAALSRQDMYDFLIDIVPRDEAGSSTHASSHSHAAHSQNGGPSAAGSQMAAMNEASGMYLQNAANSVPNSHSN
ncbi:Nuclear transcription factor Y subunit C-2 [Chytriomyces hyalinus]|nr:Nuclear transcription factor Y subunit C-2 [Chytriomyces hyalinus]